MPTEDWLKQNPKVSAHIPRELQQQLQEFMEQHDIKSNSEALKTILREYFSNRELTTADQTMSKSSQLVDNRLSTLESQIEELSQEVSRLAKEPRKRYNRPLVDHSKDKSSQLVDNSSPLTKLEGWLTTGEAFKVAQSKGYTKTQATLRRQLRGGSVPPELERLGLVANWEVRNQSNLKDNSVKWLRFE
jgi:predicted nuclease with TOPRIM domain